MTCYAKIVDGVVINVIVAEPEFFDTFIDTTPGEWIQSSYTAENSRQEIPLRKNYPSIGYAYNKTLDAFIPPCIYPSWQLNEETCLWEALMPMPTDQKKYYWDEESQTWKLTKV
jgi:hypothetical protein